MKKGVMLVSFLLVGLFLISFVSATGYCSGGSCDADSDGQAPTAYACGDTGGMPLRDGVAWFYTYNSNSRYDPQYTDSIGLYWQYCSITLNDIVYNFQVDCDDTDASQYQGATEICNGEDDDCDGVVDEGCDSDRDDYIDPGITCTGDPYCTGDTTSGDYFSAPTSLGGSCHGCSQLDCDDDDSSSYPGATEICSGTGGVNNDCDSYEKDYEDPDCIFTYYGDSDWDGYGDDSIAVNCIGSDPDPSVGESKPCCTSYSNTYPMAGWCLSTVYNVASVGGDCDDDNSWVNPGYTNEETAADERGVTYSCEDTHDNDCDGDYDCYDDDCIGYVKSVIDLDPDCDGDEICDGDGNWVCDCVSEGAEQCDTTDRDCDGNINSEDGDRLEEYGGGTADGECEGYRVCTSAGSWTSYDYDGRDTWTNFDAPSDGDSCGSSLSCSDDGYDAGCGEFIYADYPNSIQGICSSGTCVAATSCTPTCEADADSDNYGKSLDIDDTDSNISPNSTSCISSYDENSCTYLGEIGYECGDPNTGEDSLQLRVNICVIDDITGCFTWEEEEPLDDCGIGLYCNSENNQCDSATEVFSFCSDYTTQELCEDDTLIANVADLSVHSFYESILGDNDAEDDGDIINSMPPEGLCGTGEGILEDDFDKDDYDDCNIYIENCRCEWDDDNGCVDTHEKEVKCTERDTGESILLDTYGGCTFSTTTIDDDCEKTGFMYYTRESLDVGGLNNCQDYTVAVKCVETARLPFFTWFSFVMSGTAIVGIYFFVKKR